MGLSSSGPRSTLRSQTARVLLCSCEGLLPANARSQPEADTTCASAAPERSRSEGGKQSFAATFRNGSFEPRAAIQKPFYELHSSVFDFLINREIA